MRIIAISTTVLVVVCFSLGSTALAANPSKLPIAKRNRTNKTSRQQTKRISNSVSGTYKSGNDALGSELKAQEMAGGKLKFSLYSFWRCPDGTACNGIADSTVSLKDRKAQYHQDDPEYTLKFEFTKGGCTVECDKPSNFGGFNVDPSGEYKKVSSKVVFD